MLKTRIFTGIVRGIDLQFRDLITSGTAACVFEELQRDDYGLEQITLTENDIVIDVGANIGMFSIYVKKKFGCKVIAFEPVPLNFEHLKENIVLNGLELSDFELHNTAITANEGSIIKIGTPNYNTGGSSVFHLDNSSDCITETLDKYVTDGCVYLKIDCEGGEYEIIPAILAKLNCFKYIGIEYHRFLAEQSPVNLHNLIKQNFAGQIFCQDPTISR